MKEFISSGPSAQFNPTMSGFACAMEVRNASSVWPLRVRPERSVIVPETMFAGFVADAIGRFSRHASGNAIYLADCIAQANVMNDLFEKFRIFAAIVWFSGKKKFVQADGGGTESIGLNYICASAEIFF